MAEAVVIAIAHEKWQERPLMLVVRRPGLDVGKAESEEFLPGKVAKWRLPENILFVDELPHTAIGKLQKMRLREMYGGYQAAGVELHLAQARGRLPGLPRRRRAGGGFQ